MKSLRMLLVALMFSLPLIGSVNAGDVAISASQHTLGAWVVIGKDIYLCNTKDMAWDLEEGELVCVKAEKVDLKD